VSASAERAFRVFTEGFDTWWPRSHSIGASGLQKWEYEPDLARASEVEVSFTPEPDGSTRVDLEHRHFDRHGAGAPQMRAGVDSPEGWAGLLKMYASIASVG
jgi:hypothetical protein